MIKDLIALANRLDDKGLQKEADMVDAIIKKIANEGGARKKMTEKEIYEELLAAEKLLLHIEKIKPKPIDLKFKTKEQEAEEQLKTLPIMQRLNDPNHEAPSISSKFKDIKLNLSDPAAIGRVAQDPDQTVQKMLISLRQLLDQLIKEKQGQGLTPEEKQELMKKIEEVQKAIQSLK